jgi:hypothetical protein
VNGNCGPRISRLTRIGTVQIPIIMALPPKSFRLMAVPGSHDEQIRKIRVIRGLQFVAFWN